MVAVLVSFSSSVSVSAQSWTAPTDVPPAGNVAGPIDTSSSQQVKSGGISVGSVSVTGGSVFGSDGRLKIKNIATSNGSETISLQTSIDNRTDDYDIASYGGAARHLLVLQPQGGHVGIGTTAPIRALHVNGELSLTRSDGVAYINVSDPSGNGGGNLILRGLTGSGSTQTNADVSIIGSLCLMDGCRSTWSTAGSSDNQASQSGWTTLPGGIIMQWMLAQAGNGYWIANQFPKAFPNNVFSIVGTHLGGDAAANLIVSAQSRTGFSAMSNRGGVSSHYVIAIGN